MQYYKLDPCHYFTSPGLSWDAMLKLTDIKLELTRSPKEHHGLPCDGSVKSAGPLCCHTLMGNNQAHRPSACGRMSEQFPLECYL